MIDSAALAQQVREKMWQANREWRREHNSGEAPPQVLAEEEYRALLLNWDFLADGPAPEAKDGVYRWRMVPFVVRKGDLV